MAAAPPAVTAVPHTSSAHAADPWGQTTAFSFVPDCERKPLQRTVKIAEGRIIPNPAFLARCSAEGGHHGVSPPHSGTITVGDEESGLMLTMPTWLPEKSEGASLAYVTGLLCAAYAKSGGDEAVVVVDGCPPVALLNPFGTAPLRDVPFADVVSDVSIKLYTSADNDAGRKKAAESLLSKIGKNVVNGEALVGGTCIVRRSTVDRVGVAAFTQGFDIVWVVDYLGSHEDRSCLELYYNSVLFVSQSASNWMQMVRKLHGDADLAAKPLAALSVVDDEMLFRLKDQWQPAVFPAKEYTTTMPDLFAKAMEMYVPDKDHTIAVFEPKTKREVTYRELDELSTKVALYLHSVACKGSNRWGHDAVIGIHIPRCADWYILMLGVHKAGAAYLSLDPDFPANRLSYALEDSSSMALFTLSSMVGTLDFHGGPVLAIDTLWDAIKAIQIPEDPALIPKPTQPHSPCYLIYTSGSTGKPKGVLVEHINCASFVLSERKLFQLSNKHRIIQGFSTSFDASIEEIWLAFASGSALIVVEKSVMQDADLLTEVIAEYGATVLSTVPTLLATMEPSKLKALQLVIVGGEACNKEIVEMYATGGTRQFVNSYGPTEATVACCADFCDPKRPVTIGRAQPNYAAYIVDDRKQLVPPGVPGELLMAGPAVTRGYVNRDDLTREKFVHCPFHPTFDRMYHTGDLVRWNPEGKLEFLGRIDSQVKLRGFRIEVGEIENNLATFPGVTTAVVVLRNDQGVPYLCAYLICEPHLEENFSEGAFRVHLKTTLPSYMVPSRFIPIRTIPRSPAGKLDRKGFPEPPPPQQDDRSEDSKPKLQPSTPTEYLLHDIWQKHLPSSGVPISITDNFFEIGGHSLLAGKVSSAIRKAGWDQFSIRYLYSHPTIKDLAAAMDSLAVLKRQDAPQQALPVRFEPSMLRRACFLCVQLLAMHAMFFFFGAFVFLFIFLYQEFNGQLMDKFGQYWVYGIEGAALMAAGIVTAPLYMFVVLPLCKWSIIGRYKEGSYSLWSWYFLRCWVVRGLTSTVPFAALQGTPWLNIYMRLMGAKIGWGVIYCAPGCGDFDLLEIGDDTWIGNESSLATSEVVDQMITFRRIRIGKCSSIGVRCVVKGGAIVGDESMLGNVSMIHENTRIPDGEHWVGSPAARVGLTPSLAEVLGDSAPAHGVPKPGAESAFAAHLQEDERTALLLPENRRQELRAIRPSWWKEVFVALCWFLYGTVVGLLTGTPGMIIILLFWTRFTELETSGKAVWLLLIIPAAPLATAVMLFYLHLWLILFRWIVLPWHVKPGSYPCTGFMYYRKMAFDLLMRGSLTAAHPFYASIYTQFLLRALGTDVGRRVECSNLYGFTPGLVKLGDESFVADFVGLNPPEIFRGVMTLGFTEVKPRAFVGNGAVLPQRVTMHERSLLGLLSLPTKDLEADSTYIGAPAFSIPRKAAAGSASKTYDPPCHLVFARCLWEFFRTVTPASCAMLCMLASFMVCNMAVPSLVTVRDFAIVFSLFIWVGVFAAVIMVLVIKWGIQGKEKPSEYPLWSLGVWRAEFVVDCITVLGGGAFLGALRGTPLMPLFFRALGARIGKNCYLDTLFITEPDMVTIGDNCCIGDRVTIQTHLFEDRIMKIDYLRIDNRVSIGALSIVLYNTVMDRGVTVGSLSLVMKGESYPAGTHWEGVPAQRRAIPAIMALPPQSNPRMNVIPPTQQPKSQRPKSTSEKAAGASTEGAATKEHVDAMRDWLLDDGLAM